MWLTLGYVDLNEGDFWREEGEVNMGYGSFNNY